MKISKKALSLIMVPVMLSCSTLTAFAVDAKGEDVELANSSSVIIGTLKPSVDVEPVGGAAQIAIGDVSLDGRINCVDVVILQKYITKLVNLSNDSKIACDTNGDGQMTLSDVIAIQKFISSHTDFTVDIGSQERQAIIDYYVTDIALNAANINITPGNTWILTNTISPSNATDKNVVWSSSNTKVAIVDAFGRVTAVGSGNSVITCKAVNGDAKADCNVNVTVPVTSVTLNTHSIKWPVGRSARFYPRVNPTNATNSSVSYTTSNVNVATVDSNGMLTAKGVGTCTITCKALDGSDKYDTCTVEVWQPASSVSMNTSSATIKVGGNVSLSGNISPSNSTYKSLSWSTSNSSVATVNSSGVVTGRGAGYAYITCNTTDGTGLKATCKVTVEEVKSKGQQIADYAARWVGVTPYVWGGTSLKYGADCSGFVCAIYDSFGYNLWGNRTTLSNEGYSVSLSEAKPGDIVVYYGHVAIYAGNGKVTHALSERWGTLTTDLSWGGTVKCVRRIV